MEEVTLMFLHYQNQIKLYHWQTKSFARHKASDELHGILLGKIDEFMEVMQGSSERRINLTKVKMIPIKNMSDNGAVKMLKKFREWLQSMKIKKDNDLISIRDDIVAAVNKTLYLFTFQ
jgi:hypothetical protein